MYRMSKQTYYLEFRCSDKILDRVLAFYDKLGTVEFVVIENPPSKDPEGNRHAHGVVSSTHKKKYFQDKRGEVFKGQLEFFGNGPWKHCEVKDYEAYTCYMCKGEFAVKAIKRGKFKKYQNSSRSPVNVYKNVIFSEEDIVMNQNRFWAAFGIDTVESFDAANPVGGVTSKKPTFLELVEDRWKLVQGGFIVKWDKSDKNRWSVNTIAREVGEWLIMEFHCMRKTQDLPTNRKYVNHCLLSFVPAKLLMDAWLRGQDYFYMVTVGTVVITTTV